ncbi:MAG: Anaerobic nitric oxide reductase transcription regulator NorR [Myxococcota bacterium]|nr:Anaerobic nitric oxide reductase transcription regulator NorR [Myxococcota bacterium]
MAYIVITYANEESEAYDLPPREITLGRHTSNDVIIADAHVSRRHVKIFPRGGRFIAEDMGSRHGTLVNGDPINSHTLVHGDIIKLGGTRVTYFEEEEKVSQAPPESQVSVKEEHTGVLTANAFKNSPVEASQHANIVFKLARLSEKEISYHGYLNELTLILFEEIPAERVVVFTHQKHDNKYRVEIACNRKGVLHPNEHPWNLEVIHRVVTKQEALIFADQGGPNRPAVMSAMAAPIRHGEISIGALYMDHPTVAQQFTDMHLWVLVVMGAFAGAGMANSVILHRLNSNHEKLERAFQMGAPSVGKSEAARNLRQHLLRFAGNNETVMIGGPPGSGKDTAARNIHIMSGRERVIAVDCEAIPDDPRIWTGLRANADPAHPEELIGLFQEAAEGTLELRNIERLSPTGQGFLERVLTQGAYLTPGDAQPTPNQFRLIVTTNLTTQAARVKYLRPGLYEILSRNVIEIPPLAERIEDLQELTDYFSRGRFHVLGQDIAARLARLPWRRNLAELRDLIEQTTLACGANPSEAELEKQLALLLDCSGQGGEAILPLEEVTRSHVLRALNAAGRDIPQAAAMLGIPVETLKALLKSWGVA